MKQPNRRSARRSVANFFGYLGYMSCFLQWLWAALLYFSVIQSVTLFVSPVSDIPVRQLPRVDFTLPDPIVMAIVGIIVLVMVGVTVYALVKLPMNIAKTGDKVVHGATQAATPLVVKMQHKKDTKQNRARLMPKITIAVKVFVVSAPAVLVALSGLGDTPALDYHIATTVGYGLALLSIAFFGVQYLLARLLRVAWSELR